MSERSKQHGYDNRDDQVRSVLETEASGLVLGEREARARVTEVIWPDVDRVARARCRCLSHRGGFCLEASGDAEHAHGAITVQLVRLMVGAHKGPKPSILTWFERPTSSLLNFFYTRMPMEEALRAWNGERGLGRRLHRKVKWRQALKPGLPASIAASRPHHRAAAIVAGLDALTFDAWLDAIWWDACQPAFERIDADRVHRHLTKYRVIDPAEVSVRQVRLAAEVVDGHVANHAPKQYDAWLVAPRSRTRPVVADHSPTFPTPSLDDRPRTFARLVLDALDVTGEPLSVVLEDPTLVESSGFVAAELAQLLVMPPNELLGILKDIVRDELE